jgi:hypothetical protein
MIEQIRCIRPQSLPRTELRVRGGLELERREEFVPASRIRSRVVKGWLQSDEAGRLLVSSRYFRLVY